MRHRSEAGFTLVEVLVALVVVAIGLAALMVAVSGTARTSGYLRDKTLAQWIALNRLAEVRLTVNKLAQSTTTTIGSTGTAGSTASSTTNGDARELQFAGRTWHYDTRYYDTTFQSTKRIVVRVWAGDAKTKGNPLAEATGFFGSGLSVPGNSNALDWTIGNTAGTTNCQPPGSSGAIGGAVGGANGIAPQQPDTMNCAPGGGVIGAQGVAPVTTPAVTPAQ